MSKIPLDKQIVLLGEKNKLEELQKLITSTSASKIIEILNAKLRGGDCNGFWCNLLLGFDLSSYEAREKRFACVRAFLDALQKVELSYKQTYDLVARLCGDLGTFSNAELIEILEHCLDGIRMGDPKCVSWKDLLPEALQIIAVEPHVRANDIAMSGVEYRDTLVKNLWAMKWPTAVLTPIADMFKKLQLSSSELLTVLTKFSAALQCLAPAELPALAFQLFSMCSTGAQIFVPILALEKYFNRYYYKKLFEDMQSDTTDFDSIDAYSDKELLEAEETILYHLDCTTESKISELQMCVALKNFQCLPGVILTPFVISALLSMSSANRDPHSGLSTSELLTFLRLVFRSNEEERALADASVWCRDTLQRKQVDLDQVFTVLIDQNKQGKDVITPGLVNLAFVLLKAKSSPSLNDVAIKFLMKFIRKRFIFGAGIVKNVTEWMIVEQDQLQYGECLMLLSVADTFTVSECVKSINYVMNYFVSIPGEQAMRMMGFILPILKLSAIVRDSFIEVLHKAMRSSDPSTRRMAVYGFCMILKQLNNSNAQRSQMGSSGMCTQQSISGYSLMSQAVLGQRANPQRHFNMLTLEIIGLLRNCFTESLDIKRTLYGNLQRSVELNPKLVTHVLQFIDMHFRSYFEMRQDDGVEFSVHFHKIVHNPFEREHEIEVSDNLGQLILFVSNCLVIFEQFPGEYNTAAMTHILDTAIEKVIDKQMQFEDASGSLSFFKSEMFAQQLNFIEGLMAYVLLTSETSNDNVKHLVPLFKCHTKLREDLKTLAGSTKKQSKKPKSSSNDTADMTPQNTTINGVIVRKIETCVENVWDLKVLERFMKLLHEDIVNFADARNTPMLRSNCELVCYVLEVCSKKIEGIRLEPEYKQVAHSKRTRRLLTDITKVLYERCIKRLPELWRDFDMRAASLAAECFLQCLLTANAVYKKKFSDGFLKVFDLHMANNCKECPAIIHSVIDQFMAEDATARSSGSHEVPVSKDADGSRIPHYLLQSLEVLYDNMTYEHRMAVKSYTWLLHFCQHYEVDTKELGLVHKLLFEQRQKTHSGAFFNGIAQRLGEVLDFITEEAADEGADRSEKPTALALKSITLGTAESCLLHLYAALRKQIEMLEYFIGKANNITYKYRMLPDEDREMCLASLRSLERSLCSQLVHISNCLLVLTNVCVPLGACLDGILRLVNQHFVCLKNLAKHFLASSTVMRVAIQHTRFDTLVAIVGKRLPRNIYSMITYVEANVFDEANPTKAANLQTLSAKVLRETKLIPKIILSVENFNRHVLLLSKKTTDSLACFLHSGVVRDYRIKTTALKTAIERTLSRSSEIESVPSGVPNDEDDEEGEAATDDGQDEADIETDFEPDDEDEEESILKQYASASKSLTKKKEEEVEDKKKKVSKAAQKKSVKEPETKKKATQKDLKNTTQKEPKKATQKDPKKATEKDPKKSTQKDSKKATPKKTTQRDPKKATPKKATQKEAQKATKKPSPKPPVKRKTRSSDAVDAEEPDDYPMSTPENENVVQELSGTDVLQNLDAINKKAKRRMLQESESNNDPDVVHNEPPVKKRHARAAKR